MVAEANALGAAGQWEASRARHSEAARAYRRMGVFSPEPELGLLDAHHHAPPPLLTFAGHSGAVRAVVFSSDGRRALSAGDDGTLRLWDVRLGREIRTLRGHAGALTSVALSADGRVALSGGQDGTARLWDVTTGQTLRALRVAGDSVRKVALSPDGRLALSRTPAGKVQLWDVASGQLIFAGAVRQRRRLDEPLGLWLRRDPARARSAAAGGARGARPVTRRPRGAGHPGRVVRLPWRVELGHRPPPPRRDQGRPGEPAGAGARVLKKASSPRRRVPSSAPARPARRPLNTWIW